MKAGASVAGEEALPASPITKQDLMALGLSGGADSSRRRLCLLKKLGLPEHMSANAMLQALSLLYDLDGLKAVLQDMEQNDG